MLLRIFNTVFLAIINLRLMILNEQLSDINNDIIIIKENLKKSNKLPSKI